MKQPLLQQLLPLFVFAVITLVFFYIPYLICRYKVNSERELHNIKQRFLTYAALFYIISVSLNSIAGFYKALAISGIGLTVFVLYLKRFVGVLNNSLVINWRNLFSEGDHVSVAGLTGFINLMNATHVEIDETLSLNCPKLTGIKIKIPNQIILKESLKVIYSEEQSFLLRKVPFKIKRDSNPVVIKRYLDKIIKEILKKYYSKGEIELKIKTAFEHHKLFLKKFIETDPTVELDINNGDVQDVIVNVLFYCHQQDIKKIEQELLEKFIVL